MLTGNYRLMTDRPTDGPQQWLSDLAEDPTEQHNLAASRPDIVKQFKDLLAEHQSESNGPLYLSTTQMPGMIDKGLAEYFVEEDEYIYTPHQQLILALRPHQTGAYFAFCNTRLAANHWRPFYRVRLI